jgi:DNA-binding MarR family transcriptional regulator
MRLAKQIRITALSQPKQGSFLKALTFPVTFILDIDKVVRLFATVYSDSISESVAKKKIQDNFQVFLQSLSAEYDYRSVEGQICQFFPAYVYSCTYNDNNLKSLIDTLIKDEIRARAVLALHPRPPNWLLSFLVASDVEIKHVLTTFFSDVHGRKPNQLEYIHFGRLINPKVLRKLTLSAATGIDEVSTQILKVPSKYADDKVEEGKVNPKIEIGEIVHPFTGNPIIKALLPIQRINQHVGIIATTGAGKTNLCYQMVVQLQKVYMFSLEQGYELYLNDGPVDDELRRAFEAKGVRLSGEAILITDGHMRWKIEGGDEKYLIEQTDIQLNIYQKIPVLIFDWKRDYRGLQKLINAEVYDFVGNNLFTFNPLKPSGSPSQWVKEIANIMAEVISGGIYASGSFSIYVDILDQLYRDNGVYDGSTAFPTIFEVLETLESYSQRVGLSDRQKNWVASASKLFKSLAVGKTREAFSVREGISLDEILSKPVVIELDGLGDQKAKAFFISVLLQKIRNYRMMRSERDVLKHVIVIEEAQNCLAVKHEASTTITTTYREIRSMCEGIISITQIPSELSKDALTNTNTFFVLKLVHRDDKLTACNLLGLAPMDMTQIEGLEVGTCLMKTDEVSLVRIPLVEKPPVNDSDIKRTLPQREEVSADFARRTDVENRREDLNEKEWLVLRAIAESTAYNNTTLRDVLHYSNKGISSIIFTLINKGFVRYRMAKKQGVGRKQKMYFLFPYGEEAYRQKYGEYPDRARIEMVNCPYTHTEMKETVIERIGGATIPYNRFDIVIRSDNWEYPVEIETGSNNNQQIYTNIEKSVEEFGEARFIVSEQRIYYAVLQLCAKFHFDKKRDFRLSIAIFAEFALTGAWDTFEYA